jgi:phosphoinositide-3-kinase regulatory subunit 4
VETFPPSDSHVFPAYILPALSKFSSEEPEDLVREAYAENLALLAETAKRFLETSQSFKQSADLNSSDKDMLVSESFDAELAEIQEAFYEIVVEMLTKGVSTAVRRTLLLVRIFEVKSSHSAFRI